VSKAKTKLTLPTFSPVNKIERLISQLVYVTLFRFWTLPFLDVE